MRHVETVLDFVPDTVNGPIRAVAFWSAIVLPFLYIPLVASGLHTVSEITVFLGLVLLNVLALILGHHHGQT